MQVFRTRSGGAPGFEELAILVEFRNAVVALGSSGVTFTDEDFAALVHDDVGRFVEQAGFGAGQVDAGGGDLRQSKLTRPGLDLRPQGMRIEPLMNERHDPIVESTVARTLHWPDEDATAAWAAKAYASPWKT